MTPAQRFFPEVLRLVAVAYETSIDDLTTEAHWPPDAIREARRVVYLVTHDTLGLTHREIGKLMQRDQKAVCHGLLKIRKDVSRHPLLRKTVTDIAKRVREAAGIFDVFGPEAAE
jgi:chromosomal replication initiation ATPase DnaA